MVEIERTHAEFRAERESLGLSQRDVAEALDVQERSVRRWEDPGFPYLPPEDAWQYLADMRERYDARVAEALAFVGDAAEEAGKPPKTVTMTYYRSQREYDDLGREEGAYGLSNAMTREVAAKLRGMGCNVVISFLDEN